MKILSKMKLIELKELINFKAYLRCQQEMILVYIRIDILITTATMILSLAMRIRYFHNNLIRYQRLRDITIKT